MSAGASKRRFLPTKEADAEARERSERTADSAPTPRIGWWGRTVHRLTADESELENEDLQKISVSAGAVPVGRCGDHQQVCVAGAIQSVTVRTRAGSPSLEADICDGSGTVTLVFLGRRRIPGIEAGHSLKATGLLTLRDHRSTIFNPRYELLPTSSASA
ncbi:MAG: OB-fold nucleic acid binding domain-containing protein [Frankia sp.]